MDTDCLDCVLILQPESSNGHQELEDLIAPSVVAVVVMHIVALLIARFSAISVHPAAVAEVRWSKACCVGSLSSVLLFSNLHTQMSIVPDLPRLSSRQEIMPTQSGLGHGSCISYREFCRSMV